MESSHNGTNLLIRARPNSGSSLHLLHQAYEYAKDLGRSPWDFAVEIGAVRGSGLTNSDIRWMLFQGLIEHAHEIPAANPLGRSFGNIGQLRFNRDSCFVLTEKGVSLARSVFGEDSAALARGSDAVPGYRPAPSETPAILPHWHRERQVLTVGDVVVKHFKTPARNQVTVLSCFEEDRWPPRIDDPLPAKSQINRKRRLHDTINSLNRNQQNRLLRFSGDGLGSGILWQLRAWPAGIDMTSLEGSSRCG